MPNPLQPPPPMLGLQKASSIGPDPKAEFMRSHGGYKEAGVPNPESEGLGAVDALSKMAREYAGPVQETLGELNPFHTPVGGEGMYNVARMPRPNASMEDGMYQRLLDKFGMGRK